VTDYYTLIRREEEILKLVNGSLQNRGRSLNADKNDRLLYRYHASSLIGFILLLVFYATLTIQVIPVVWTGAALMGVVFIIYGLYHIIKG